MLNRENIRAKGLADIMNNLDSTCGPNGRKRPLWKLGPGLVIFQQVCIGLVRLVHGPIEGRHFFYVNARNETQKVFEVGKSAGARIQFSHLYRSQAGFGGRGCYPYSPWPPS